MYFDNSIRLIAPPSTRCIGVHRVQSIPSPVTVFITAHRTYNHNTLPSYPKEYHTVLTGPHVLSVGFVQRRVAPEAVARDLACCAVGGAPTKVSALIAVAVTVFLLA